MGEWVPTVTDILSSRITHCLALVTDQIEIGVLLIIAMTVVVPNDSKDAGQG